MEQSIYKNWWLMTIKGVLAIIFGLLAIVVPAFTITVMMVYFGIFIVISGVFLIIGSFTHKKTNKSWSTWLFEGILDLIIGGVIIFHPQLTLDLFIIIIGIWAITVGFTQLFSAFSEHKKGKARWLMLINAILIILLSFVLFNNPFESEMALTYLIGIFALVFGIFITVYSINLRKLTA